MLEASEDYLRLSGGAGERFPSRMVLRADGFPRGQFPPHRLIVVLTIALSAGTLWCYYFLIIVVWNIISASHYWRAFEMEFFEQSIIV
jgi:hypothetical protein